MDLVLRRVVLAILLMVAAPMSAKAEAGIELPSVVNVRWEVAEVFVTDPNLSVSEKVPVKLARALPVKRWAVSEAVDRDRLRSSIPQGAVFAETQFGSRVICEPGRRLKQDKFSCLADVDGDGKYDHLGSISHYTAGLYSSTRTGFLVGPSEVKSWEPLATPVGATPSEAMPANDIMDMNLKRSRYCRHSGCAHMQICATRNEGKTIWGGPINSEFCRDLFEIYGADLGKPIRIFPKTSILVSYIGDDRVDVSLAGLVAGATVD